MIRRQVDPAQLSGRALDKWYRRSPQEIEEEREFREQAEYEAFFGRAESRHGEESPGSWQEARVARQSPPMTDAPPPRRSAPAPGHRAPGSPLEGLQRSRGEFFEEHSTVYPNPTVPAPLNRVEPSHVKPGYYSLGDGSVVSAGEVERIYAEQKRLLEGNGESAPAARVHAADRFKDGYIPTAQQLAKGDRELDATCHPYGGWELDPQYPSYSKRTQRYEAQITRAPGLDYVVRNPGEASVKFDGCGVWLRKKPLLEAKGRGRAGILDFLLPRGATPKMLKDDVGQVRRQIGAAQGRPVDWHAAESRYRDILDKAIESNEEFERPPTFNLYHTPAL